MSGGGAGKKGIGCLGEEERGGVYSVEMESRASGSECR